MREPLSVRIADELLQLGQLSCPAAFSGGNKSARGYTRGTPCDPSSSACERRDSAASRRGREGSACDYASSDSHGSRGPVDFLIEFPNTSSSINYWYDQHLDGSIHTQVAPHLQRLSGRAHECAASEASRCRASSLRGSRSSGRLASRFSQVDDASTRCSLARFGGAIEPDQDRKPRRGPRSRRQVAILQFHCSRQPLYQRVATLKGQGLGR